jgi:hypothetical protein
MHVRAEYQAIEPPRPGMTLGCNGSFDTLEAQFASRPGS